MKTKADIVNNHLIQQFKKLGVLVDPNLNLDLECIFIHYEGQKDVEKWKYVYHLKIQLGESIEYYSVEHTMNFKNDKIKTYNKNYQDVMYKFAPLIIDLEMTRIHGFYLHFQPIVQELIDTI
jgi:hypothetical protein